MEPLAAKKGARRRIFFFLLWEKKKIKKLLRTRRLTKWGNNKKEKEGKAPFGESTHQRKASIRSGGRPLLVCDDGYRVSCVEWWATVEATRGKKIEKYQIFFLGVDVFKKGGGGQLLIQWIRQGWSSWRSRWPCAAWGAQWAWRHNQPCRPGGRVRAAPRRRWW